MKESAVFTMVKNEKWFLPIWLNYYSKFFNEQDIYILNHASTDDSIKIVKEQYKNINIINLEYEPFDDVFKINEIKKLQESLLQDYKCTLYSDPDELIVPVETFDLKKYIEEFLLKDDVNSIKTNGWEIIHLIKKNENKIDLTKSILSQRLYWFHSPKWYSKFLLSKTPLNWSPGLHVINNNDNKNVFNENLYLIHLHRMDYELAYTKNILNNQFKRPKGMELGNHVFITNPEEFHKHFWGMEDSDEIKEIPNNIKDTNLF